MFGRKKEDPQVVPVRWDTEGDFVVGEVVRPAAFRKKGLVGRHAVRMPVTLDGERCFAAAAFVERRDAEARSYGLYDATEAGGLLCSIEPASGGRGGEREVRDRAGHELGMVFRTPAEALPGIPPGAPVLPPRRPACRTEDGGRTRLRVRRHRRAHRPAPSSASASIPRAPSGGRRHLPRAESPDVPVAPSGDRPHLDGLHIEDVSFPRPWGAPTTGYFTGQSDMGREDLARAVLAHALGGTAPTSRASCGACHGNGWLTALDPEHNAHVPAYRPDGRHVCSCGGCRGTGLRPLPVQLFAATFLPRLHSGTGPGVSRREILEWTVAHAPAQPATRARCAEGPRTTHC